jgi:hypothetical protein
VFDPAESAAGRGKFSSGEKTMRIENLIRRSVFALAFAGLLAGGAYAQSQDPAPQQKDIQNDKKDIRKDKKDLPADRADRNKDQRDINHDKRDLHKDRKDLHKDRKTKR